MNSLLGSIGVKIFLMFWFREFGKNMSSKTKVAISMFSASKTKAGQKFIFYNNNNNNTQDNVYSAVIMT